MILTHGKQQKERRREPRAEVAADAEVVGSLSSCSTPLSLYPLWSFLIVTFDLSSLYVRFSASVELCRFVIFRFCLSFLCIFATFPASIAFGDLLLGSEQPAKQADFWNRIADAEVVYIGENHGNRKDTEYRIKCASCLGTQSCTWRTTLA
jgi:hypothetical protein